MTLLHIHIADLNMSEAFVERSGRLGLATLADIMAADFRLLKKKRDFSYMWYADLLNMLKQRELLDEFQQKLL